MPALTPPEYRNISLYNLIFSRLALPTGGRSTIGPGSGYQKWIGAKAFARVRRLPDPDWSRGFRRRSRSGCRDALSCGIPGIALREIDHELHDSVHSMRPDYMANYRQEDGFPPHASPRGSVSGAAANADHDAIIPIFCWSLWCAVAGGAVGYAGAQ